MCVVGYLFFRLEHVDLSSLLLLPMKLKLYLKIYKTKPAGFANVKFFYNLIRAGNLRFAVFQCSYFHANLTVN